MSLGDVLLVLAIYVLVAARITRLVNYDQILDPIRLRIAARAADAFAAAGSSIGEVQARNLARYNRWTKLSDFLVCPWCIGFWVCAALAPVAVAVIGWPWWTVAALPFAASHLVGIGDPLAADDMEIVEETEEQQ
ncbi:hypothetical protein SEA_ARGIE_5 [Mycobacterium phage Argie]|nr:hypothetical protein SEA_ARGIE_5 [Mycobacterium phage Argie]